MLLFKRIFSLFLLILFLQSCTSNDNKTLSVFERQGKGDEDYATLYFYRNHHLYGKKHYYDILINDDVIGRSVAGAYFKKKVEPGQYRITLPYNSDDNDVDNSSTESLELSQHEQQVYESQLLVDVEKGDHRYIRTWVSHADIASRARMEIVPKRVALLMMSSLHESRGMNKKSQQRQVAEESTQQDDE